MRKSTKKESPHIHLGFAKVERSEYSKEYSAVTWGVRGTAEYKEGCASFACLNPEGVTEGVAKKKRSDEAPIPESNDKLRLTFEKAARK